MLALQLQTATRGGQDTNLTLHTCRLHNIPLYGWKWKIKKRVSCRYSNDLINDQKNGQQRRWPRIDEYSQFLISAHLLTHDVLKHNLQHNTKVISGKINRKLMEIARGRTCISISIRYFPLAIFILAHC